GKQMHAENDSFPDPVLMVGSADGNTLFIIATDTAYHWKINEKEAKATVAGTLPGRAVSAMVGGGKLIVATPEAVVLYADFDPVKPLPEKPTLSFKDSAGAKAVAISPTGNRVAWGKDGEKIVITDATDKQARRKLPVPTTSLFSLAFDPTGNRLGVLGGEAWFRIWDVSDEADEVKEVWKARIHRDQDKRRGMVAFSPDGKLVTPVSATPLLIFDGVDDKPSGTNRQKLFAPERFTFDDGPIHNAVFSHDGHLLIVGGTGLYGGVEVWDLATHELVRKFTTGYGEISRICLFPDGKRIASAGAEEAITVWDLSFRGNKGMPKADELAQAWTDLESLDPAVSYPAVKILAAGGNRGTDVIVGGTKEMLTIQRKIAEWIEDLGSQTFSIREVAMKELLDLGIRALPAVNEATESEDPDVRDRAIELQKKFTAKGLNVPSHGLAGDTMRLFRAVQALEEIGTPEAKSLLELIANSGGLPANAAKAALKRMKK
ncbi:MAG: WD40 repeat domain-containing protein, partial [Planctomycetia bacterium]|nr:WD40 repeat domain-containing protein [Planctomycetia bacterium]